MYFQVVMKNNEIQPISILLPYYWGMGMPQLYEDLGFKILWSDCEPFADRKIETEKVTSQKVGGRKRKLIV